MCNKTRTVQELQCEYLRIADELRLSAGYMLRRINELKRLNVEVNTDHVEHVEDFVMFVDASDEICKCNKELDKLYIALQGGEYE